MLTGTLSKMRTELQQPIQYALLVGGAPMPLNPLLGQHLVLEHTGNIFCVACGRKTSKSFDDGYCFPCSQKLAECDMCIVKPERCHFAEGTCRQPEWGMAHCMQPHYVYLANSSGIKVGITREHQIPFRWIDQGATQALPIFKVKTRYQSGLLEVLLAQYVPDKTDWRKMLKGDAPSLELPTLRDELLLKAEAALDALLAEQGRGSVERLHDAQVVELQYPSVGQPEKLTSLSLEKTPSIRGKLLGIKGQYLLFEEGVLNIRRFGGFEVKVEA